VFAKNGVSRVVSAAPLCQTTLLAILVEGLSKRFEAFLVENIHDYFTVAPENVMSVATLLATD
jgi:hypothetical protein